MEKINLSNIRIKAYSPEEEKIWNDNQEKLKLENQQQKANDLKRAKGFLKKEVIPTFDQFNPKHQDKSLGAYEEINDLLETVKRWCNSKNGWLTIIGGVGIGKTHLLKAAIDQVNGYYITAYDFDERIKDFRQGSEDKTREFYVDPETWLNNLANIERHLAIDDIGAGYIQKGWTLSKFEKLIDIRYRNQLPTAIATNLSVNDLSRELGSRIESRIKDKNFSVVKIIKKASDLRSKRISLK